jgi:hypothetical protein
MENLMKALKQIFLLGACLIAVTGCQNTIRLEVLKEKKISRSAPQVTYLLNVNQEVVDKPIVKLTLTKESTYKVIELEEQVTEEIYTPYRGLYELYEFPSGLLVLPGAVVINLLDFVTLGLLPNSFTDSLLNVSFTGMNPCLNWESEKRSKTNILNTETKEVDKREEVVKRAAANEKVTIEGGQVQVKSITTDDNGIARIYLNDTSLKTIDDIGKLRELKLFIRKGQPEEAHVNLILDRGLRMRLVKARNLIGSYNKNKTGADLAKLIMQIEKLKFPRLALNLETDELKAFEGNKEFVEKFNTEIIKLSTSGQ